MAYIFLETLPVECAELYAHALTPGRPITIKLDPFPMNDNILGEEEITYAVMQLGMYCARGLSGMRAKHLKCGFAWQSRSNTPTRGSGRRSLLSYKRPSGEENSWHHVPGRRW